MFIKRLFRHPALQLALTLIAAACSLTARGDQPPTDAASAPLVYKVRAATDRLNLTVNSSRILSMDEKIPRVSVNNKDILDLTPLSAKEVQIFAKKTGVTQVNLWDEQDHVHAIDVIVNGDARELIYKLHEQFPGSAVRVSPTANGIILDGYVDNPSNVGRIVRVAEEYYTKVIDNMKVGGAQQVQLHVRVMEVSRTKLRDLGFDFSEITSGGSFITSTISGLANTSSSNPLLANVDANTVKFGILSGGNSFFGLLSAMQKNEMVKILAEPTLTTVSGRPAYFQEGGKVPYPMPASIGQPPAIQFQKYGTQVDFVPIVLGHGSIRLEVRPAVSELDFANAITIAGTTVPALKTREVETGVELKAGQTLAIAGLIQTHVDTERKSLPWIGDLPYLGVPFRRMTDTVNEVELLVLVRPELVEPMDCNEVPPSGPGGFSRNPSDCELYMNGYIEVPLRAHAGFGPNGGPLPAEEIDPRAVPSNRGTLPEASSLRQPAPPLPANPRDSSYKRPGTQSRQSPTGKSDSSPPGLIGPSGYDVKN